MIHVDNVRAHMRLIADSDSQDVEVTYLSIRGKIDGSKGSFSKWIGPVHFISALESRLRRSFFDTSYCLAACQSSSASTRLTRHDSSTHPGSWQTNVREWY